MSVQRHAHWAGVIAAGEGRRWHNKSANGHDRYLLVSFFGVGVGVFEAEGVGERERLNNT